MALEIVLQATQVTQLPEEPFQEPLTYGNLSRVTDLKEKKKEVNCIAMPRSYINLTYIAATALTTLLHPGDELCLLIYHYILCMSEENLQMPEALTCALELAHMAF